MNELRQHLQAARGVYRSAGYAGDLAADVAGVDGVGRSSVDPLRLAATESPVRCGPAAWRWWSPALAACAAAAAVAAVVYLYNPVTGGSPASAWAGAASLGESLESVKLVARENGLWPAGASAGETSDEGTNDGAAEEGAAGRRVSRQPSGGFRIVPDARGLDLPAPPPLGPSAPDAGPLSSTILQESA